MSAEKPVFFSGYGFSLRGEKNRFVLPPAFRNAIHDATGNRTLCLGFNQKPRCLTGFGLNRAEDLERQIDLEREGALSRGLPFDEFDLRRQLFSFEQIPFDSSGRFLMPDYLMDSGRITDAICVIGFGRYFTIWAPEVLYMQDDTYAPQMAACRSLEAEARGKGKGK